MSKFNDLILKSSKMLREKKEALTESLAPNMWTTVDEREATNQSELVALESAVVKDIISLKPMIKNLFAGHDVRLTIHTKRSAIIDAGFSLDDNTICLVQVKTSTGDYTLPVEMIKIFTKRYANILGDDPEFFFNAKSKSVFFYVSRQ